jgi:hypothetical protein
LDDEDPDVFDWNLFKMGRKETDLI